MLFAATPDGGSYSLMAIGTLGAGVDPKAALTGLAELALSRISSMPAPTAAPTEVPLEGGRGPRGAGAGPDRWRGRDHRSRCPATTSRPPGTSRPSSRRRSRVSARPSPMSGWSSASPWRTPRPRSSGSRSRGGHGVAQGCVPAGPDPGPDDRQPGHRPDRRQGRHSATIDDQGTTYMYPHNDVLWLVSATEPNLTEIFQKLP